MARHENPAPALDLRPATLDRAARSVEAVAGTGAPVARRDARGPFLEVLDMGADALDLSRLIGAPVLDAHRAGSRADVLGVVEAARLDSGALIVRLRFSESAPGEDAFRDVAAGVLRGVSVGYVVETWREETAPDGARIRRATRWRPIEVSLVPIPADPSATFRSHPMEDTLAPEAPPAENRAAVNAEIRGIAQTAGLSRAWADAQIDAGAGADAARAAAFEAMRARAAAPLRAAATIGEDHDAPALRCARIGEALYARANSAHALSEPARAFYGLSMPEIARDLLRRAGAPVTGLAPAEIVTRALHTTSDFAMILGEAAGRTLRDAYRSTPAGLKQVARMRTARDFRAQRRLQLSEAQLPEKINEAGEFKRASLTEGAESYRLDTFGRIFGITRQALVNDDVGAFVDMPRRLGQAAAEKEAQLLVDVLTAAAGAGPTMGDGAALFHATHGNLAGTGGALGNDTLVSARLAMRRQKGPMGRPISVTPKFLIVAPEQETNAERMLAPIAPATTDDANPFSGRLTLIVEPRLTSASAWYVVADPAEIDGLEYAYLESAPGPQIETRNGFDVDGVEFRVRMDFGAGFVDWRGWYRNPGV